MPLSYRDLVIADGASHYWRLGETSGTVALDIIGGATGTISGGVTLGAAGAIMDGNRAMTFDGATGKLVTAMPVLVPVTATVEVWLKTLNSGQQCLFSTRTAGAVGGVVFVGTSTQGFLFCNTAGLAQGIRNLNDNLWHHVVYVLNGSTCTFYIDAVLDATVPMARADGSSGGIANIGWEPGNFWNGTLDDIAIYPRALTAAEIAAHYQAATIPSLPDSSDIDNAIIAKLSSDPTLLGLCPNGVYYAQGPPGCTRLVIVQVQAAHDVGQFGGTAYEDIVLQVEARMLSTAGGDIKAAAARIHDLLHDQPLTVAGYSYMTVHREERLRVKEPDDTDPSMRWDRRGGLYRVQMSYP